MGDIYSDGAQIYQLLSNGPWADLHRAFAVAGSSLVTAVRPRDYDIEAILRAAATINEGFQGLVLRLLASDYYLDHGRIHESAVCLNEAGLIYNQSSPAVPADLLTVFVFGAAYLCRNSASAREWWTDMEAKKPTRFNTDYWRAASALHWMEGDLKEANECWAKAQSQAQDLPKFGAYDFERDRCSLLKKAMDEASVPA